MCPHGIDDARPVGIGTVGVRRGACGDRDPADHRAVTSVALGVALSASAPGRRPDSTCEHCGLPQAGRRFCCPGCAAAYETIEILGLGRYYRERFSTRPCARRAPTLLNARDLTRLRHDPADGAHELILAVDGLQCGACVWLIESVLAREPDMLRAAST